VRRFRPTRVHAAQPDSAARIPLALPKVTVPANDMYHPWSAQNQSKFLVIPRNSGKRFSPERQHATRSRRQLRVAFAVVNLKCKTVRLRDFDVRPRMSAIAALDRARPSEEIQPRLTDGTDTLARRQLSNSGNVFVEHTALGQSRRFVGVNRDSCEHAWVPIGEVGSSATLEIRPEQHPLIPTSTARRKFSSGGSGLSPSAISRCVWLS